MVNVKLAGTGGFKPARELLREARAHGLDAFPSTLDGPWASPPRSSWRPRRRSSLRAGLATLDLFTGDLARALPQGPAGTLKVPQGPGLGVQLTRRRSMLWWSSPWRSVARRVGCCASVRSEPQRRGRFTVVGVAIVERCDALELSRSSAGRWS